MSKGRLIQIPEVHSDVPGFLQKLYHLVDDPDYNNVIGWDIDGTSFYVEDQTTFAHDVLPIYFKHRNITSFIRQLNLYGFRKEHKVDMDSMRMRNESKRDTLHFKHPSFIRDHEELLMEIKRRGTVKNELVPHTGNVNTELLHKVLTDVTHLQSKQDDMNSKLEGMKRENEVLWRELTTMRHKHSKQQTVVNKLIQFLVSVMGRSGRGQARKRPLPLMLGAPQDASISPEKISRPSNNITDEIISQYLVESPLSEGGPEILDVTDRYQNSQIPTDMSSMNLPFDTLFEQDPAEPTTTTTASRVDIQPYVQSPESTITPPIEATHDQALTLQRSNSTHEITDYLDSMEVNLTGLKDILGGQYNFDPTVLQTLFNADGSRTDTFESLLQDIPPWITDSNEQTLDEFPDLLSLPLPEDTPTTDTLHSTLTTPSISTTDMQSLDRDIVNRSPLEQLLDTNELFDPTSLGVEDVD